MKWNFKENMENENSDQSFGMSQESEDDLHLQSDSNLNDCNLLLNNKRNAENSIFDDSSLATVRYSWIQVFLSKFN